MRVLTKQDAGPALVGVAAHLNTLQRVASMPLRERRFDLVEARCDLMSTGPSQALIDACSAIRSSGTPVLVTIRSRAEGGAYAETEAERLRAFHTIAGAASALDVELESEIVDDVIALARAKQMSVVVSQHHFEGTPPLATLHSAILRVSSRRGCIPKVATRVRGTQDAATLRQLVAGFPDQAAVLPMGDGSGPLRVQLAKNGSRLTYAYLDEPSAPGQLSFMEMDDALRACCPAYAVRRGQREEGTEVIADAGEAAY